MRLTVTGARGMLGRAVCAAGERRGHDVVALGRAELDVTDPAAARAALERARPDAVVNCAAWTDVDGAEAHPEAALAANGAGAGNVARAAARLGARVVQVSTDYVFDGSKREPWLESDPPRPLSQYGRSKLRGEEEVAAATPEHAIVRSAWLFGAGGRNFVDTILRLASERDEVRVVADQVGSPTWTGHLAGALVELAERGEPGVHHVAGAGACSWYELARAAVEQAGIDCHVEPTTSDAFPRPAPRPAYSVLGTERRGAVLLAPWVEGLRGHLAETAEGRRAADLAAPGAGSPRP